MGRTLVQRLVGDVRLVVRCTSRPTPQEFDEHVAEAVAMAHRTRVALVVLVGDGADYQFDFEQRAKLCQAGLFSTPHAMLAPPTRPELVASLKWLGAQIRPFAPDAFEEACDFLEVPPSLRSELSEVVVAAKGQLGQSAH